MRHQNKNKNQSNTKSDNKHKRHHSAHKNVVVKEIQCEHCRKNLKVGYYFFFQILD